MGARRWSTVAVGVVALVLAAGCSASDPSVSGPSRSALPPTTASAEPASPGARDGHELVWFEPLGEVLLVNGSDTATDVWGWDGSRWDLVDPDGDPAPRRLGGVTYLPGREALFLYGGIGTADAYAETWKFDGARWVRHDGRSPRAVDHVSVAYDPEHDGIVLFGGRDADERVRGETWAWDGERWSMAADTGPAPRIHHAMTFDPASGSVLLVGGQPASDAWTWNGQTWSPVDGPGEVLAARMAFSDALQRVVLWGGVAPDGSVRTDTWTWDGARWEQLDIPSPPGRLGHSMAYDPERGVVVMYGGFAGDVSFTDVWEFDGETWTEVTPAA